MPTRIVAAILFAALAFAATVSAGDDLNVVVILDNSGSMTARMPGGDTRIAAAKRSLQTVLDKTPATARVGVVLLNPPRIGEPWLVPLGPIDPEPVRQAVRGIVAGGPTPLGAAMKTAADALLGLRDQQRYGSYKLLIVSDGEANDRRLVERYLPEAQARGLLIDVIGVAMAQQHSLATRANTYRNAADPASLEQAISAVVLGESATDSGDAGESDFEVLEPLPAELATASLAALTSLANEPIGQQNFQAPPGPPGPPTPAPQPNAPQGDADRGGGFGQAVFVVVLAVFVLLRLAKALKKAAR
ncbi:MAG: vWA domain-containing protein [Planctomycetota bacterium]